MEDLGGVRGDAHDDVRSLLEAFRRRDPRRLQALAARGVDLESRDPNGWTVLLRAAERGEPGTVQWILEAGSPLDAVACWDGVEGRDALMIAAADGHGGVVDLLLAAGASAVTRDDSGFRAIDLAAQGGHDSIVARLLVVSGGPPKTHSTELTSSTDAVCSTDAASSTGTVSESRPTMSRVEDRGLGRFDGEDTCILVRAAPGATAAWWCRHRQATVWRQDAYGEEVLVQGPSYLVFRFRGHAWTVIRAAHNEGPQLSALDAAMLSKAAPVKEVVFIHHSTAAKQLTYRYYLAGNGSHSISWPNVEPVDTSSESDCFDDSFQDEFSDDVFVDRFDDNVFLSHSATNDLTSISAALRRVDVHLRELDAYVPSWGRLRGEAHRLEISGLDSSAFERMDFLTS